MREKMYLSQTDKKIAGVCGGIAEWLGIDTTIVRIMFIVAFLAHGFGPTLYLLIWAIMPKREY